MNYSKRKAFTIIAGIVVAIIVSGIVVHFRPVTIPFKEDEVRTLQVLNSAGEAVTTITSPQQVIWLAAGSYTVHPEGEKVATDPYPIEISAGIGTVTITFDAPYSSSYLTSITPDTVDSIDTLLTSEYGTTMDSYTIVEPQLYQKGEWFSGLLFDTAPTYGDTKDFYRFIATKKDGSWQLLHRPELVITKDDYPNTPTAIIDSANKTTVDESLLYATN